MGLRYEDGAMFSNQYAKNIYRFLGFVFTEKIKKYVTEITSSSRTYYSKYNFRKTNSSQTMDEWRKHISIADVAIIDNQCEHLYSDFGYKKTNDTDELRSEQHSLLTFGKFEGMFECIT